MNIYEVTFYSGCSLYDRFSVLAKSFADAEAVSMAARPEHGNREVRIEKIALLGKETRPGIFERTL